MISCANLADTRRKLHRIETAAEIGVGKVQANRDVSDSDFTRSWVPNVNLFPAKNLGAADLMKANGMRHLILQILAQACNPHLSDIVLN
jgi:hypothetical protein